jgi:hypothetical protein
MALRILEKLEGKRFAFFVLDTRRDPCDVLLALIAVDGESGFYETSIELAEDLGLASEMARTMNAKMGVTQDAADAIVIASMKRSNGRAI